jgi:hypothetical protein
VHFAIGMDSGQDFPDDITFWHNAIFAMVIGKLAILRSIDEPIAPDIIEQACQFMLVGGIFSIQHLIVAQLFIDDLLFKADPFDKKVQRLIMKHLCNIF